MALQYKLSSRNKSDGSISNTDFYHSSNLTMNCRTITIKNVSFPNLLPNIRTGINDTLTFIATSVPITVKFTEGFYTLQDIIDYLNANTSGIIWAISSDNRVQLQAIADDLYTIEGNIKETLGFITVFDSGQGDVNVLPYVPNLFSHTHVYLTSQKLSSGHNLITSGNRRLPVIAVVPITAPYGSLQHYTPSIEIIDSIVFEDRINVGDVDVQLVDDNGIILSLPPNHHLDVVLHITPT